MKRLRLNISMLFVSLLMVFASVPGVYANKLKLFINNLEAGEGISEVIANKTRDYFSLTIFENFNKVYQVVTDDDIKIMYKKAEDLQAAGCDDQACVLQIADAINADEIIYGTNRKGRE